MSADPGFMDWTGCDAIMHAIKKNYYSMLCLLLDGSQVAIDLNKRFFSQKITYLIMAAKV
jgi:hypothetical protein